MLIIKDAINAKLIKINPLYYLNIGVLHQQIYITISKNELKYCETAWNLLFSFFNVRENNLKASIKVITEKM